MRECMLCGNDNLEEIELLTLYSDGYGNDAIEHEYFCKEDAGCSNE